MTCTIDLHKTYSGFANLPDGWRPALPGEDAERYTLPEGYTVGRWGDEPIIVHHATGKACDLVDHSSGRPQIVGPEAPDRFPVLRPTEGPAPPTVEEARRELGFSVASLARFLGCTRDIVYDAQKGTGGDVVRVFLLERLRAVRAGLCQPDTPIGDL